MSLIDIYNYLRGIDPLRWFFAHPILFYITFAILISCFISLIKIQYQSLCQWIKNGEKLFEIVTETRRQARVHQNVSHEVSHTLEPHKKEKINSLKEVIESLPDMDPLRRVSNQLTFDLNAATSFQQTETIS